MPAVVSEQRRRPKRYPRRLTLRYGEKELERAGFTLDISATGAFVVAQQTPPPVNARIHLQLMTEKGGSIFFEGIVRRHKIPPVNLRSAEKMGFGVRFLTPAELLAEMVPHAGEKTADGIPAAAPAPSPPPAQARPAPVPAQPQALPETVEPREHTGARRVAPAPAGPIPGEEPDDAGTAAGKRLEVPVATQAALVVLLDDQIRRGGIFVRTTQPFTGNELVTLVFRPAFAEQSLEAQARVLSITAGGVAFGFENRAKVLEDLEALL